jgi:hypothetical protein
VVASTRPAKLCAIRPDAYISFGLQPFDYCKKRSNVAS